VKAGGHDGFNGFREPSEPAYDPIRRSRIGGGNQLSRLNQSCREGRDESCAPALRNVTRPELVLRVWYDVRQRW
jgi:hypothetical protein